MIVRSVSSLLIRINPNLPIIVRGAGSMRLQVQLGNRRLHKTTAMPALRFDIGEDAVGK